MRVIDGQRVNCDGPACPGLVAPKSIVRFADAPDAGSMLLPPLAAAFAGFLGFYVAVFSDAKTAKDLIEFQFVRMTPFYHGS